MSDDVKAGIVLPSKAYNVLKPVVQIVLPATATLYAGLAVLWGFPKVTEIVGTITLLTTFLGVILGLSSRTYNASEARYDGSMLVDAQDDRVIHTLDVTTDPEVMAEQKEIILKVQKVASPPIDSPPKS